MARKKEGCAESIASGGDFDLLLNAIGAIPGRGTIRIRTERAEDHSVRVSISDTGKGIPQEKLPRLFHPTFHAHGPRVGAGLGLSICHKIVQDHRGQILVESTPGQGSTFTVVLPIAFAGTARPSGSEGAKIQDSVHSQKECEQVTQKLEPYGRYKVHPPL
jgi:hypothetical protein